MTCSTSAIIISAISIVAAVLAAPTTHDQRQDGQLNVAAKLENILIFVALPSTKTTAVDVDSSELASYLALLADRGHSSSTQLYNDAAVAETTDSDSDDDGDAFSTADDDESKEVVAPHKSDSVETIKSGEKPIPKARNLWGPLEDVVDNRQGASLKKELSWGEGGDDSGRSSDHNEVGLIPNRHLTLLGPGIEDCGPDRHRNSYGVCAPLPSE